MLAGMELKPGPKGNGDSMSLIDLGVTRKAGAMLAGMDSVSKGRPGKCDTVSHLSDLGISRKDSSRWQREATVPEEVFGLHCPL